jgi:hypothetical protein
VSQEHEHVVSFVYGLGEDISTRVGILGGYQTPSYCTTPTTVRRAVMIESGPGGCNTMTQMSLTICKYAKTAARRGSLSGTKTTGTTKTLELRCDSHYDRCNNSVHFRREIHQEFQFPKAQDPIKM